MRVIFRKQNEGILCELIEVKEEQFRFEDGFYSYDDELSNAEFVISFRIKIAESSFSNKNRLSTRKKYFLFKKAKTGFYILFSVPKGKYSRNETTDKRFYFYQEQSAQIQYTFKMQEVLENAFDYECISQKKADDIVNVKRQKLSPEERRVRKQKWLLEHPFQGGGFSPR